LVVANVIRPHGVAGEVACGIVTEFPQRFRRTETVYLSAPGDDGPPQPYSVQRTRIARHRDVAQLVLKLEGVDDRDAAMALRGTLVQVPADEAWKLPRGRYYWHQIIGLRAVTGGGRELGTVKDILETGANDVYVIQTERGELLLPAIKQVIKKISPEEGIILVELLPGMEADE
jgi:16S rRNA processing protein RimM